MHKASRQLSFSRGCLQRQGQRRMVCAPSQGTSTLKPLPTSSLSPFSNQDVLGEKMAERHRQKPQSFLAEPDQLGRLKPEEPISESLLTHPKEQGHKPLPPGKRALKMVYLPGCCLQTVHCYWLWRFQLIETEPPDLASYKLQLSGEMFYLGANVVV